MITSEELMIFYPKPWVIFIPLKTYFLTVHFEIHWPGKFFQPCSGEGAEYQLDYILLLIGRFISLLATAEIIVFFVRRSSLYQTPTAGKFFKSKKKSFRVRVCNVEFIFLSTDRNKNLGTKESF